jgi:CDP-diacylglycerol--glycerol-3-phosphate 3-phosphatidyltransferase
MLPTLLTLFRIAMGPAIAGLVLWAAAETYKDPLLAGFIYALCLVLFLLASVTDWLDGWLARKLDAVTPLGAALDHTADKVLIVCVLVALAYAALPLGLVAATVIILGRDVAIAGLREGLSQSGRLLPVNQLGKWKAAAENVGRRGVLRLQDGGGALRAGEPGARLGLGRAHPLVVGGGARADQRRRLRGGSREALLVEAAEFDHVQDEDRDDEDADGNERGH